MSFREKIIKDTMMYSLANYIAMGIGIFVSIITKNILGTLGTGYFAMVKVFSSYGGFSDLGTRDAMLRETTQAAGAGNIAQVGKVRDTVFSFTLLASLGVIVIFTIIAFFFTHDPLMKRGVLLAGILVLVTQFYNFSLTFMRSLKEVSHVSLTILANIVGVALFSILGAFFYGVLGLIVGLIIATFISSFFAYKISGMRLSFHWDGPEVWRLVRIGFPLVLAGYAMDTFLIVDTIMIGKMIGYNQLGFYTIALMSIQQINSLGRFSQIVLLPHIQGKYGENQNLADTKTIFVKSTMTLVYFLPVVIALVFFGVPGVVHYLLPKFIPGLVAMRILVPAYYFVAVNEMSSTILFTINKQERQIPLCVAMIGFAILLNYLFIKAQGGIEGVALATMIAYFFYFLFFFHYAFNHLMAKSELHRSIATVVLIFLYSTGLLHGIEWACHLSQPLIECVVKLLVFLFLFSPILIVFEKKEGIFKTIGSLFGNKLARMQRSFRGNGTEGIL